MAKPVTDIKKIPLQKSFAEESKALTVAKHRPSEAMLAMFAQRGMPEIKGAVRLNLPPLVKAVDESGENIPIGGVLTGIIVDVVKSPVTTIQGALLWLHLCEPNGDGKFKKANIEITFPATGVIRNALATGEDGDKAVEAMKKHKGSLLLAQRMPDKPSKYKKSMTMWAVQVVPGLAKELDVKVNP